MRQLVSRNPRASILVTVVLIGFVVLLTWSTTGLSFAEFIVGEFYWGGFWLTIPLALGAAAVYAATRHPPRRRLALTLGLVGVGVIVGAIAGYVRLLR
jgi:hypothetical protein